MHAQNVIFECKVPQYRYITIYRALEPLVELKRKMGIRKSEGVRNHTSEEKQLKTYYIP